MLGAHVVEAFLDLRDHLLAAGRLGLRTNAGTGIGGVLVLDDDSVVDRIDPTTGHGELMLAVQLYVGFFLDERQLPLGLDADFLFLVGHRRGRLNLVGELGCLLGDQLIQ